jgi:hypothetical protein
MSKHLSPQYILSRIEYIPETGQFRYKAKKVLTQQDKNWNRRYAGKATAVANNQKNYLNVSIDDRKYRAHRIAFLAMTGSLPHDQVDHINGKITDNRWCNLRLATNSQNQMNKGASKLSTTGIKGLRQKQASWFVDISSNGTRYRKCFRHFCDALKHYNEMAPKLQGEFMRLPQL